MASDYTHYYLPPDQFGPVESTLAGHGLIGPIRPIEDIRILDRFPEGLFGQFAQATGWAVYSAKAVLKIDLPIYYCLVKSEVSNALAMKFPNWACIALSDGLLLECLYLTAELSLSDLLAEYRIDLKAVHFNLSHPADRAQQVRRLIAPKRLLGREPKLVKTLSAVSAFFVAFHELSHIANGHLGGNLVGATMSETSPKGRRSDLLTYRMLEYDADALAADLTLDYFLKCVGNAGDSTEYFRDQLSAIHTVFAGIFLVMCVLEAAEARDISDYHDRSHPPATFRYFAAFSAATNMLKKLALSGLAVDEHATLEAQKRVVRAIEFAMTDRCGLQTDPDLLQKAIESRREHDLDLYRRWAEIRPQLERAKLGSHKLAPAQYGPDGKRLRPGPYD